MQLEPADAYRPQYHLRLRRLARGLDRFPRLKARLADAVRAALGRLFEPAMVTTERVVEYPFVFENLNGVGGPILDLGCCGSRLPLALASRGHRVVGIDFRPYPFRHPNLAAVRGDAMRLPFASGRFAAVVAISVVEHIGIGHYGDPSGGAGDARTVAEIARVLAPGGRALLTVPYGKPRTDRFQRVYDAARLAALVAPLDVRRVEYARADEGLWRPCTEPEAAAVDWAGPSRAVALLVAEAPARTACAS